MSLVLYCHLSLACFDSCYLTVGDCTAPEEAADGGFFTMPGGLEDGFPPPPVCTVGFFLLSLAEVAAAAEADAAGGEAAALMLPPSATGEAAPADSLEEAAAAAAGVDDITLDGLDWSLLAPPPPPSGLPLLEGTPCKLLTACSLTMFFLLVFGAAGE